MMRIVAISCALLGTLALAAPSAQAAKPDPDAVRLSAQIEKLGADPVLGQYALAQRTLARNAITDLQNAGYRSREHARFIAEQRVALAEASAKVDADRATLDQLQRARFGSDGGDLVFQLANAAIERAGAGRGDVAVFGQHIELPHAHARIGADLQALRVQRGG